MTRERNAMGRGYNNTYYQDQLKAARDTTNYDPSERDMETTRGFGSAGLHTARTDSIDSRATE